MAAATKTKAAGATKPDEATLKGKLVELAWWMKKQGYAESTIMPRTALLRMMVKSGANLLDPESVKEFIAKRETWGNGTKANAVDAYSCFLAMEGQMWIPPHYRRPNRLPFIPLESEIAQLILASGKTVSTFLQGLKETAADPGELWRLKWIDINQQSRTISINYPVKGHNPRILTVSADFVRKLNLLPKTSERVFTAQLCSMRRNFCMQRKRIAARAGNPRPKEISFTTFRHWKATMVYHETKDVLLVMKMLGHKSLKNTLIYIDLEKALYGHGREDEFLTKVPTTLEEVCDLIDHGWEFHCEWNGHKIFRKRK